MYEQKHNDRFSLILIPKNHRRVWRWEVKQWWLKAAGIVVSLFLMAFGVATWGLIHYWSGYRATDTIRIQNAAYEQERASFQAKLAKLEEAVERADRMAARLEQGHEVASLGQVTEGIGPISETLNFPSIASAERLELLRESNQTIGQRGFAFDNLEDKMLALRGEAGRIESRLGKVYKVKKQRRAFWGALPTVWPVSGWVTSGFGPRRANRAGGTRFHEGIDIAAPVGTTVQASGDGVVTFAGYKGGFGRMVIIDHGFGISTRYAHNSTVIVAEGERVHRGTEISQIGMTGRTTGPHLHYEVMVDGVPVDPMRYLVARN